MSDYLIKEITNTDNVDIRLETSVVGGGGEGRLERLVLKSTASAEARTLLSPLLTRVVEGVFCALRR
jgi:thioredoxin reductase (NADPH)